MAKFTPDVLPKDDRQIYDAATPDQRQQWEALRLRGQTDQMYLATELLGMDFQPEPHLGLFALFLKKDPEQEKQLSDLDTDIKKRMILWPRGLFKTSAVVVEIVQLILNFPNIRILILSGSKELAERQLARVKRVFERPSAKFRSLYPDFCGEKLGTIKEFTVPNRTLDFLAEPTVAISTARCVKAGAHFDVIFVDDLVNDQNYKSVKALRKTIEEYKDISPLLQPAGYMFVTGTRYSFGDTYEYIWEKAQQEMKEKGHTVWQISSKTCWVRICKNCNHSDANHNIDGNYKQSKCTHEGCECLCFADSGQKKVLFPQFKTRDGRTEGHTVEFLESERISLGDEFFACQYENNPIASGAQTYTDELLNKQSFYHLKQVPVTGFTFLVGDLSYVGDERNGEKRDKSVLYINRLTGGRIWTFDCIPGKWDSQQVAENLLLAFMRYRPGVIWLEQFLGWEAYDNVIKSLAVNRGVLQLPLEWLPMDNQKEAKKVRIGSIKPWLMQDKLRLFAGMPEYETLCKQLKRWPKLGKHDDYGDCLGLVVNAPHGAAAEKLHLTDITPEQEEQAYKAAALAAFQRSMRPKEYQTGLPSNGCGSGIVC